MKMIVRRNQASAILGILVVVVAFLGIPMAFKTILFIILGVTIAVFGFSTHRSLEGFLHAASVEKMNDRVKEESFPDEALIAGE